MRVLYFAWMRQRVGVGEEEVTVPDGVTTVAELIDHLAARGPNYAAAFENRETIRAAVDQSHVPLTASIRDAEEVAFFPPVTGG